MMFLDIQRKMTEIAKNIEFYEQYQELPNVLDEEKYPIPTDAIEMVKLRNNLRSQVSKAKRNLGKAAEVGKVDIINKYESKLQYLRIYLGLLEQQISITDSRLKDAGTTII